MSLSPKMVRWGALAGVAAGVTFALSGILNLIAPPMSDPSPFIGYLIEVVIVIALALTLVAIAGLHAVQRQSRRYGVLGAAGALLTFVGYALVLVTVFLTTLAAGQPFYAVPLVGGLVVLVGSLVLGAMTLYARVLPWWCGVVLIVGFPLADYGLDALLQPLGDYFLLYVAPGMEYIVFAVVWGLIGYALLSRSGTGTEQPSRVS